ncbi:MAG: M56 family metallopeptidase, partial [Saprospiraceae bacterium]|nr:M56 family metallopeptidase [Saprospiraceae bacterium]
MQLIDTYITEAIALSIVHSLWQGALIVAIISGLTHLNMLKGTERRFFANLAGTLVLFASVVVTFFLVYDPGQSIQEVVMPVLQITETSPALESLTAQTGFGWQQTVALGWGIGAVLYLARILVGWYHARSLTRGASQVGMHWQRRVVALSRNLRIRAGVRLRSSHDVTTPFVFGVLRPVIVFPALYFTQLTPAQIEAILLHELAHIRRHDFLINLVQLIIEGLLFFNPAIWWLGRQMRSYREFACDDKVQSTIPDQRVYLEALYRVAALKSQQPAHAVSLFHHNSELIMRVKRMLHATPHTTQLRPVMTTVFGMMALIGLCLVYSGTTVNAQKTTPPPVPDLELGLLVEDLMPELTVMMDEMMVGMDAVLEMGPLVSEMTATLMPDMERLVADLEPVTDIAGDMAEQLTEDLDPMLEMLPEMIVGIEPLVNELTARMPAILDAASWAVDFHTMVGDTVPPESEKVKALRKQIEQKQQEIEELSA